MFWADKIAAEIAGSGAFEPLHVDDMFTPSGYAHIGSLRGPLVHDMIFRALRDAGHKVRQTYIFNDFDPIDGLPSELSENFSKYMGFPLRSVPSPDGKKGSFAEYFADDFRAVLESLGFQAEYLSSWDMYHAGKFNQVIRQALDAAEDIQEIYRKISGSKKKEKGWLPLQVVCERCSRLGTTRVTEWDGETVAYTCEPEMVAWAKGCGFSGRMSPFNGNGKLPWKVDWPAHWKVLGVSVEGAGKDHSSSGGSRDIARELCRQVFQVREPFNLPYEFFLIGGKKMSSSKGLGLKARDLTSVLPPAIGRFLFTRTDYRQAIEFDPSGTMAIPDLFDEYDRCYRAFVTEGDANLSRAFVLAQINATPRTAPVFLPRFRDVANYIQLPNVDLAAKAAEMKGGLLTDTEKEILAERARYAKVWLSTYAPEEFKLTMLPDIPPEVTGLSDKQRSYLLAIVPLVEAAQTPDALQLALYEKSKNLDLKPQEAFAAVYLSMIGKLHGPKAAWLLLQYERATVIARLKAAASGNPGESEVKKPGVVMLTKPEYFSISKEVKEAYPSISVGIAIIRGITVRDTDQELEREKAAFAVSLGALSTGMISAMPEVVSYRKLYREMGIDWHSRRPSPEALLRRFAQGKGLATVNTCVDAYNLAVMANHVSVGAFDMRGISFPTELRFAGEGDEILLHGDTTPTRYTARELAYYDGHGGYNIDFNFRDAQRVLVSGETKDIWINVDGVYEATPEKVEKTLNEAVSRIVQYCGGTVEFSGLAV